MDSDNKASFTRIGFIVLAATIAITATLIWLGGLRGRGDESIIETCYDRGVSGLSVGSPVNLRGVPVGEVREIGFVGAKYRAVGEMDCVRICIRMAISHKKCGYEEDDISEGRFEELVRQMVARGLRATVVSSGITGLSRIELDFQPPEKASPIPNLVWRPKYVFVPPQISLLDNFADSATKVMNQINKMDLTSVWSNISVSVKSLAQATESARVMIETNQEDVDKIVEDFTESMRTLRELTAELKDNPSLIIRERKRSRLPETEK